ncbi:cilia- and flagella-associated protein 44-like [Antennarius striatus]|uniref:cilia- and flagella-associated protein 44-like n=1 Tax=Antennarius striatus TaxID=241820 RepID=UPI0035B0E6D6
MEKKNEMESNTELSVDVHYKYEELCSRPYITPNSQISENLLQLRHSFGYDSGLRGNLQLLDDRTLIFIAGNLLVLLDLSTKKQRYLRSSGGGGIGSITVHLTKKYFAVAEKGNRPNIIIYEYPSLRPYRILRDGTEKAYSSVDFNKDGSLLASVGNSPDYMLTVWDWRQEQVTLRAKAISQEVFKVRFSPHNPELLTSSGFGHIKFWEMANTWTGLKLLGYIGRFGATDPTDIEGFMELPGGKVVSGSSWGNLLLWEHSTIRMEIGRTNGQRCHKGTSHPFFLEEGQMMTFGSDGMIRVWDIDSIDFATGGSKYELDPMNEKLVGRNVCICSMVRSSQPDSTMWFAQDSSGAIWKVDLSFTHTSLDPERLFSFHAGAIQGLDVSKTSHLMATTATDRSVKVFDFLSNREVTNLHFSQGGTVINWAPPLVNQTGGLLVAGFEDGVVRLLELYDPQKLNFGSGYIHKGGAKLRLKQAFRPHNGPVTAIEYKHDGVILATGSLDATVFFFSVGGTYNPIGFIHVPGPVRALEWSSFPGSEDKLLIMCQNGHVIEVQIVDLQAHCLADTFLLCRLPSRSFRFRSIKSRIKREEEITRLQALEKSKEKEEEAEKLSPIHIPDPPSPLFLGFYSQPDHFWLSMGGFDSGYLYHCKFSKNQDEDPNQRQDEPFHYLLVHSADEDPILSITFSSDRQLMFCGMHSGAIRVYPLQPDDHSLTSMQAYWTFNLHDNQYGHLQHIRCSHDNKFVLTAGADGNIFSFSMVPPEELEQDQMMAMIPSPRVGLGDEPMAQDIEDQTVCSIEMAKQKLEKDHQYREAQVKITAKQKKLAELQQKFKQLLKHNLSLPEHVRLNALELQIDKCFSDEAEKVKVQKVKEVKKQMNWDEERCNIGLSKLQDYFRGTIGVDVVSVVAIQTNHRVSTYRVLAVIESSAQQESSPSMPHSDTTAAPAHKKSRPQPVEVSSSTSEDEGMVLRSRAMKQIDQQAERFRKAAEKADRHRAAIEKRKKEWAQLYVEKPEDDCEDPKDVQAIEEAKKNIGDLKLRSDKNFTVPKHLRMNTETTMAKLKSLEEKIHGRQTKMNERIMALRDAKVCLVSQLLVQAEQLQEIQAGLSLSLHRPPPALPTILPEETPEKKVQHSDDALERYRALREQRLTMEQEKQERTTHTFHQLEKEVEVNEVQEEEESSSSALSTSSEEVKGGEELEEEIRGEEEVIRLYEQDCLLEQMEDSICQFDAGLRLLHHEKMNLDWELKLAELHQLKLYRELLLHKEFKQREESLQDKLNKCMKEEASITCQLEECDENLKLRQAEVAKLQDKEKAVTAAFQALVGEENKFEKFLTKVFKMKIKCVKKEENRNEEEEYSDEDSVDDDDDYDGDYDSVSDEEGAAVDYNVCPVGCEPGLFQDTVQLRERRLDLEELLLEKRKSVEALKRESGFLVKKQQLLKSNRKAAEDDMDLIHREKQLKMNELDVAVPLRLSQIEFVADGSVPSDLTPALVLDKKELRRLQDRIKQFEVEKNQQKDLYSQARQHHLKLLHDRKDKNAKIEELEKQCNQLMMAKYGRMVDLEVLVTMTGSKTVEELKQKKLLKEAEYVKEMKQWDIKLDEAHEALMELTRCNTERLFKMTSLLNQKKELEHQLNRRQRIMVRQFQDSRRCTNQEDVQRLQDVVNTQSQEIESLRTEISFLSCKGVHVLPPGPPRLPQATQLPRCPSKALSPGVKNMTC